MQNGNCICIQKQRRNLFQKNQSIFKHFNKSYLATCCFLSRQMGLFFIWTTNRVDDNGRSFNNHRLITYYDLKNVPANYFQYLCIFNEIFSFCQHKSRKRLKKYFLMQGKVSFHDTSTLILLSLDFFSPKHTQLSIFLI